MSDLDLSTPVRIHLVGIGGAGMSAIATVLVAMGHQISGSDVKDGAALGRLRAQGVTVFIGHAPEHIASAEVVARSSAIPETNIELETARARGIVVLSRAELLRAITAQRKTIAVSGTHGKTTTSSMLALILMQAGLNPSFLIGGEVNEIGTNAAWNSGEWLVVEADESDGTFLALHSAWALVTNVEADHLEHYGSFPALTEAFGAFLRGARLGAVVCADDRVALEVAPQSAVTYGLSETAHWRLANVTGGRSNVAFDLGGSEDLGRFELPVPGVHNALNAAGAVVLCRALGVHEDVARAALARFAGVARRFEFRGAKNGITFVDDYAHLPSEVAATLAAARRGGWGRIVAVFQPHRYSRVAALAMDFGNAFVDADVVVLSAIYAAGEAPIPGVSAERILDAVLLAHPGAVATYLPERTDLVSLLKATLRPGDCCLTMGAGDLTDLAGELLGDETW